MANGTVQIVDSVASSPTVALDLNDGATWIVRYEGTDLTPPPLSRAVTANLMTDGGFVSAAAYPNRVLKLDLEPRASSVDALALEIQKIAREMDRPDGSRFLKWQPAGETNPVFFPLLRSDFAALREVPSLGKLRRVQVDLMAGPFGVGLLHSLGSKTIKFDPAGSPNPCYVDLTGIKGDVDAPLVMFTGDTDLDSQIVYYAVRSRGTPSNVTWFRQAEALTLTGVGDGSLVSDGTASGSSNNAVEVSFAHATMRSRVNGTFPTTGAGSVDWAGTYRVVARLKKSSAASVINVRGTAGDITAPIGADVQLSTFGTGWQMYDLGLVQIPFASAGTRTGWDTPLAAAGARLDLYAERVSGSGTMTIDFIALLPADTGFAIVQMPVLPSSGNMVVDGVNRAVFPVNSAGELGPSDPAAGVFDGRLPRVDPRATTNRLFVMPGFLDAGSASVAISGSAAWDVSYNPLYRYVRPAST